MTSLRKESEQKLQDNFNRFKSIESVQRREIQLNNLCKAIDTFLPKIKKNIETGTDLSPSEKKALEDLNDKYSALLKELNDEFKKFPY